MTTVRFYYFSDFILHLRIDVILTLKFAIHDFIVGAESDQHVNIYSFVVRCDRMWPSTQ